MKRNYKSLLSIALVLLLVAITSLTFAYWDELTGSKQGTIDIGEGKRVTITETLKVPESKKLIPATALVVGDNDVQSITVKYNVAVTELVTGYHLDVTVTTGHELLIASKTISAFTGKVAEVTIVFTLQEPDATTYAAVANKTLSYTVNFDYNNIA